MDAPLFRQIWVVLTVLMNMLGQGMLLSYTTCLLPALQQSDSTIKADLNTASWLASIYGLAGIPGCQMSSILMNIYGRRRTHILALVPGIIGGLTIYLAQNIPTLMVGRFLGGITAGASFALGAIIIGEYTDPKHRGMFLNLKTASVNLGSMLMHILGLFLSWRHVVLLGILPYFVSFIITFTWPESPPWLASKGRFNNSKQCFSWLRGNTEESNKELEELLKTQRKRLLKVKVKKCIIGKMKKVLAKFTKKNFLKPFFIMIISSILLEASGRHIFPAYAIQIIGEVAENKTQSFYYTLAIDIIITASALISSLLVKNMKRRVLLFSTGFPACVVLTIACTYLILVASEIIPKGDNLISIGLFVLYFILANLGCTVIPLTLWGELFPLRHRAAGSAITAICLSFGIMIALQITPYLLINIKIYGTFLIFDFITCSMLLILYFTLPETKDKTLQEIEDYFHEGIYKENEEDKDINIKILK